MAKKKKYKLRNYKVLVKGRAMGNVIAKSYANALKQAKQIWYPVKNVKVKSIKKK